jgi:flavin-dependent dehydrogenase
MKPPVVIIGAGLSGLSLAILLRRLQVPVTVLEKDSFPRQKVCGEYISVESEAFVRSLGVETAHLPHINTLHLTSNRGREAQVRLKTGGFGISRWTLDHQLAQIAQGEGADIKFGVTVRQVDGNVIHTVKHGSIEASHVIGAYGKSNRLSEIELPINTSHFVGIKYHVKSDAPEVVIEMHVFKGGYCGFSKIEDDLYCLCYLADAAHLKSFGGNIDAFEEKHLSLNPKLRSRFAQIEKVGERAATSQFHFSSYRGHVNNQLLIGDASGFIPPITGNGMSLAFRSAANTAPLVADVWHGRLDMQALYKFQQEYVDTYLQKRITKGVFLQNLLLKQNWLSDAVLFNALNYLPFLGQTLANTAVGRGINKES